MHIPGAPVLAYVIPGHDRWIFNPAPANGAAKEITPLECLLLAILCDGKSPSEVAALLAGRPTAPIADDCQAEFDSLLQWLESDDKTLARFGGFELLSKVESREEDDRETSRRDSHRAYLTEIARVLHHQVHHVLLIQRAGSATSYKLVYDADPAAGTISYCEPTSRQLKTAPFLINADMRGDSSWASISVRKNATAVPGKLNLPGAPVFAYPAPGNRWLLTPAQADCSYLGLHYLADKQHAPHEKAMQIALLECILWSTLCDGRSLNEVSSIITRQPAAPLRGYRTGMVSSLQLLLGELAPGFMAPFGECRLLAKAMNHSEADFAVLASNSDKAKYAVSTIAAALRSGCDYVVFVWKSGARTAYRLIHAAEPATGLISYYEPTLGMLQTSAFPIKPGLPGTLKRDHSDWALVGLKKKRN